MINGEKSEQVEKPSKQLERFQEAARTLGCNEAEKAFDAKLAEVAKHKPVPIPEPEKK